MNRQDLAQTISVTANLAVLAGVVFLVIELGQNQQSLDEERRTAGVLSFNNFRDYVAQSEELTEIWLAGLAGEEQSATRQQRFDFLCTNFLYVFMDNYYRLGADGNQQVRQGQIISLRRFLDENTGLQRCWNDNRQRTFDTAFSDYVEAVDR